MASLLEEIDRENHPMSAAREIGDDPELDDFMVYIFKVCVEIFCFLPFCLSVQLFTLVVSLHIYVNTQFMKCKLCLTTSIVLTIRNHTARSFIGTRRSCRSHSTKQPHF